MANGGRGVGGPAGAASEDAILLEIGKLNVALVSRHVDQVVAPPLQRGAPNVGADVAEALMVVPRQLDATMEVAGHAVSMAILRRT